jgi:hypothetical protein
MQLLDGLPVGGISLSGLVVMFVLAILTGRLIPRATHELMLNDRDQWRDAAQKHAETVAEQSKQITELMEAGRTALHVAESLHQVVLPQSGEGK